MIAPITLLQLRINARRNGRKIVALVIMANDDMRMVEAGPRGGWRFI